MFSPTENEYALELCPIPKSINTQKLMECIQPYINPRQEFYKETKRFMSIEDGFSEWWTAKASGGILIGNGNTAMDVMTSDKEGIDAMCVIMKENRESNEKSLIQNFKCSGNNLDMLFDKKEDNRAIELFMSNLQKKLTSVKEEYQFTNLYILAYISLLDSVYVVCFKYNITAITSAVSTGFTKKGQSINIGGFIREKFGNVKLYKSKKRVELRLYKKCITENPFAVKIYPYKPEEINMSIPLIVTPIPLEKSPGSL